MQNKSHEKLSEAALERAKHDLTQGQEQLHDLAQGPENPPEEEIIRGRILTGMALPVAAQKRIAKRFEELLGKEVRLSCHLDRRLLAGVRVEINGYSYDGSLKGQLGDLHKVLTRPEEKE